jgi:multiple sugar transport system substrate-binding protein
MNREDSNDELNAGRAVVRGALASALTASMLASTALAAPPVDLSKWSPEYVRSIAGTEDIRYRRRHCGKVTPLTTRAR